MRGGHFVGFDIRTLYSALPRRQPRRRGRRSSAATSRPRRPPGCGRIPPARRRPVRRGSAARRRSRGCFPGGPTQARPATAHLGSRAATSIGCPRAAITRPCAPRGGCAGYARRAATNRPPRGSIGRRGDKVQAGRLIRALRRAGQVAQRSPGRTSQIRARATLGRPARRRTISGEVWPPTAPGPCPAAGSE